jgi:hypothetical protein
MVSLFCQEKLAKENSRPIARHSDESALGIDAYPTLPSPVTFQDWCCIDKRASFESASFHELPHPLAQDIVIVTALGIKADGKLMHGRHEVHSQTDNRLYTRHKEVGLETHFYIATEIVHLGVVAKLQPPAEMAGKRLGYGFCLGQPASNKAQALGLGFDVVTLQ